MEKPVEKSAGFCVDVAKFVERRHFEREQEKGKQMKKFQEFEIDYYQDEDGWFTAVVPAIRGCVASGKTLKEAYRNSIDAIESCLEAREKGGSLLKFTGVNENVKRPQVSLPQFLG